MRIMYIEFCGDNQKDSENYKRYCGSEEFKPLSPSDEVIKFIEFQAFANQQLHIAKLEQEILGLRTWKECKEIYCSQIEKDYLRDKSWYESEISKLNESKNSIFESHNKVVNGLLNRIKELEAK